MQLMKFTKKKEKKMYEKKMRNKWKKDRFEKRLRRGHQRHPI